MRRIYINDEEKRSNLKKGDFLIILDSPSKTFHLAEDPGAIQCDTNLPLDIRLIMFNRLNILYCWHSKHINALKEHASPRPMTTSQQTTPIVTVAKPDNVKTKTKQEHDAMMHFKQEEWKLQMQTYNEACHKMRANTSSVYSVIWGQMIHGMQNTIAAAITC